LTNKGFVNKNGDTLGAIVVRSFPIGDVSWVVRVLGRVVEDTQSIPAQPDPSASSK